MQKPVDSTELLEKIATPTRLAQTMSQDLIAEDYDVFPWLLDMERRILEAWFAPGKRGLVINVASQSGKSSYTGLWFPSWLLGMEPTTRFIYVTYGEAWSTQWTRRVRDALLLFGEQLFDVRVNPDMKSASEWQMQGTQGGMKAAGITGGITGRPGNVVIVEDVIKTMKEATSPMILDDHWKEFTGMLIPRVQRDGLILVIATRYADADLSGRLIEYIDGLDGEPDTAGIQWEAINYQAIAEPPEGYDNSDGEWRDPVLGRPEGEELVTRHGDGHFTSLKAFLTETDPFTWAAIYQGNPQAPKGTSFPHDCWGWYDPDDEEFMADVSGRIRVWDLAATEGGSSDYTVGTLWGRWQSKLVLLDVQRFRKNAGGVRAHVKDTAFLDGRGVPVYMEREKAGSGKAVVDLYAEDMPEYLVQGISPDGTKPTRINWYSNVQQRRRLMLPKRATWLDDFLKEHRAVMPTGRDGAIRMPRFDDQLDSSAFACLQLLMDGTSTAHFPNAARLQEQAAQAIAAQLGVPFGETVGGWTR